MRNKSRKILGALVYGGFSLFSLICGLFTYRLYRNLYLSCTAGWTPEGKCKQVDEFVGSLDADAFYYLPLSMLFFILFFITLYALFRKTRSIPRTLPAAFIAILMLGCGPAHQAKEKNCKSGRLIDSQECIREFAHEYLTELTETFHERAPGSNEPRGLTSLPDEVATRYERVSEFRKKYHTKRMQVLPGHPSSSFILERFQFGKLVRVTKEIVRLKVNLELMGRIQDKSIRKFGTRKIHGTWLVLKKVDGYWRIHERPTIFLASYISAQGFINRKQLEK